MVWGYIKVVKLVELTKLELEESGIDKIGVSGRVVLCNGSRLVKLV